MDKTVILALVFCATFALIQAVYLVVLRSGKRAGAINRRLSLIEKGERSDLAFQQLRRERWLGVGITGDYGYFRRLVIQSGLRVTPMRLILLLVGLAFALLLVLSVVLGRGLAAALGSIALAGLVLLLAVQVARLRRIARFSAQLPDAIDVMVRSLRAGHPIPRSLALVAGEMRDPAGSEFGIAADELTYGADLSAAMEALYARVGQPDLRFLVVAISVQSATGGSLAEVLANLSSVIRQRFKLRRKVRAISAEGRYSAMLLSVLPVLFFGLLNLMSGDFYGEVWSDPMVPRTLGIGLGALMVGNFIMYRMVNYKV